MKERTTMRVDDTGLVSIIYVEPADEKQTIFEGVGARRGFKNVVVLVLPNEGTKAFRSPTDFRELMIFKRQGPAVGFVIPKPGVAQWARANHFTVYPSLSV